MSGLPASDLNTSQSPLISAATQVPDGESTSQEERTRKRDFFRFGKKDDGKNKSRATPSMAAALGSSGGLRPSSPLAGGGGNIRSPGSPSRNSPYGPAASPRAMRSASPRTHSPASSMIFERSVQEDVDMPLQPSSQIPSHIITENHIPAVLDATSDIVTDKKLNPDKVEIITHATHQPAAVTLGAGQQEQPGSPVHLGPEDALHHHSSMHSPRHDSDNGSNYANLDSADVRRLSFISFADVVHGEHDAMAGEVRRGSVHMGSTGHGIATPRSPSPMRSPVSSTHIGTSPPTSIEASFHEAPVHPQKSMGDLNVETMRQALRSPASSDLSGSKTVFMNAMANHDGTAPVDKSFR